MTTRSIGDAFAALAARDPEAVAVRCGDQHLTRDDLERRSSRLAGAWIAGGMPRDTTVAVTLGNGIPFVVACVAAWKAGAAPLALSADLPDAERAAVLAAAAPWTVVATARDADVDPDAEPPPAGLAATSWKISTSSGSTGAPRLLRAGSPARVDPDAAVAPFVPRRAVQLVSGPLTHAAPFTYAMRGLMTGHELVVLPRFDAGDALHAIEAHRVTWGMLVPTTMARIWRHPDRPTTDVSSLESVLHLAARCPPDLKRQWIAWLGPERVVEVYAGTEAQGLTMIDGQEWLARPGSVGRPVPGSRFRVVDRAGGSVPPGVVGELQMQRDGGLPGWHSLGDLGRIDADGFVHVLDRVDDMITTGGELVAPADVEAVLDAHPLVGSSVVVGRPDDDLGERVHAVVHATATLGPEELASWVRRRLAPAARPRTFELVDEPLRATTGKARRRDWRTTPAPAVGPRADGD